MLGSLTVHELPNQDKPREKLLRRGVDSLTDAEILAILLRTGIPGCCFRLIAVREISKGTLNESLAHPREVFKPAITHSAYAFVLAHNHPSGDPTPSDSDLRLTRRIAECARLLQMQFLDHLIVGSPQGDRPGYFSFKEAGIL
jgi:DNA repair protein RadC